MSAPTPTENEPKVEIAERQAPAPSPADQQSDNIAHALAGAGGGLLAMTLTYPLITLSTRAQVESSRAKSPLLATVKSIIDREGPAGLYSGISSALFGISITNFVYYYWYEWTRAAFERAALRSGRVTKRLTTGESMIAGALAGSATVLLTNPIWVVNTRMTARQKETSSDTDIESQEKKKASSSTIGTLMSLLNNEGPQALFAGVLPALVLVINPILQYTIFEQLKNLLEARKRRVTPTDSFYLGAIGKLVATALTYPYLTVKSRAHVAGKDAKKENMLATLQRVYREEGWAGLYNGIGPKAFQSVLTAAFLFAFKDVLYDMTVSMRRRAKGVAAK